MADRFNSLRQDLRAATKNLKQSGEEIKRRLYYRRKGWQADRSHDPPDGSLSKVPGAPDHVLFVIIDALRPDSQPLPNLDCEWTTAIAPSTWTFPSVTSLLTGCYPHQHGAVAHTAPSDEEFAMPTQTTVEDRLPKTFEAAGYETFGAFAFSMAFLATRGWFQTHRIYSDADAEQVLEAYKTWRQGKEQTFAYLHLGDLHAPLCPPDPYVTKHDVDTALPDLARIAAYTSDYTGTEEQRYYRSQKRRLYNAGLDYVTDCLAEAVDTMWADTLIVLTGDHGEALYEHADIDRRFTDSRGHNGVGHGGTPLDQVARVPLAVAHPDHDLLPEGGWASLCDLPVTLTDSCLETELNWRVGRPWQHRIPSDRVVICEGVRYGVERKAAYRDEQKIVYSRADDAAYCARVTLGSRDEEILPTTEPDDDLLSCLPDAWGEGMTWTSDGDVGPRVENHLRSLGYR